MRSMAEPADRITESAAPITELRLIKGEAGPSFSCPESIDALAAGRSNRLQEFVRD